MSDPVADAVYRLGMETNWEVDVIGTRDRLLIVRDEWVIGEITPSGQQVMFPEDKQHRFEEA